MKLRAGQGTDALQLTTAQAAGDRWVVSNDCQFSPLPDIECLHQAGQSQGAAGLQEVLFKLVPHRQDDDATVAGFIERLLHRSMIHHPPHRGRRIATEPRELVSPGGGGVP